MRLDKYLLLKSFYNTRSSAQNNIKLGNVSVNNKIVNNCHLEVNDNDVITINKTNQYVSRGAYKLLGAIDEFKIDFNNQVVLDIGSSTGGFTQVAIQFGAKHVYSVDVGTESFFSFTKFISLSLLTSSLLDTNLFRFLFVNIIPPKATRQIHMNKDR